MDNVMAAAACQLAGVRTTYSLTPSGVKYVKKPYSCGCVPAANFELDSSNFPQCAMYPFYYNCDFLLLTNSTLKACVQRVEGVLVTYGQTNNTNYVRSAEMCSVMTNYTSGVFSGCSCVSNEFFSSQLDTSRIQSKCLMYDLNSDASNCNQITYFLAYAYQISTAGGILCLLFCLFHLFTMIRVSCCPSCCTFSAKQVIPITEPMDKGTDGEEDEDTHKKPTTAPAPNGRMKRLQQLSSMVEVTEEVATFYWFMNTVFGFQWGPQAAVKNKKKQVVQLTKAEKKEASPLYLAWYQQHPV